MEFVFFGDWECLDCCFLFVFFVYFVDDKFVVVLFVEDNLVSKICVI